MKQLMKALFIFLFFTGCTNKQEIQKFDKIVSLARDANNLYFRSKGMGDCPNDYVFNHLALEQGNQENINNRKQLSLKRLIDLNSLRMVSHSRNLYRFEDKNYKYLVIVSICDNVITYVKK